MKQKTITKPTVGIIGGTGGMGGLFGKIFKRNGYHVMAASRRTSLTPKECARHCDLLIISVPISATEKIIEECTPLVKSSGCVLDLTSLKIFPTEMMLKHSKCEVVGCHPVFGPSVKSLSGQVVVLTPCRGNKWLPRIKRIFKFESVHLKISTPERHDEIMAVVQGLMHFTTIILTNAIKKLQIEPKELLAFSSPVYRIQMDFAHRILNQNPELYADIQLLNDFFLKALATYEKETKKLSTLVRQKQRHQFIEYFIEASNYLGKEKNKAEKRTDKIIEFAKDL